MIISLSRKLVRRLKRLPSGTYNKFRKIKYSLLSKGNFSDHRPIALQPILLWNNGIVSIGRDVKFGFERSPEFWSSYTFLDCRMENSKIIIGDGCHFNNALTIICEATNITIGSKCLVGNGVMIFDSDFHALDPTNRLEKTAPSIRKGVEIGENVFVGSRAIILKGSKIGSHSVVGAGAIVSGEFPERSLITGNPAKLIRTF